MDAGARLDRSIVGSDSHIGSATTLEGSILHAHARVDDSCSLSFSLLAEHAVVRSHTRIEVGSCCLQEARP